VWIEFGEKLDGHLASEMSIFGQINSAHSALTERFNDPVMGDRLTDHFEFPSKREWRRSANREVV
jgi:hypothetical protein